MVTWTDRLLTFLTIAVPILLFMWRNRHVAKKETEIKHTQNQRAMQRIEQNLVQFPLHHHTERTGILTAEGIRRFREGEDR